VGGTLANGRGRHDHRHGLHHARHQRINASRPRHDHEAWADPRGGAEKRLPDPGISTRFLDYEDGMLEATIALR
jgi:hypothetical protein